jgi:hypothetical protein
VFVFGRPKSSGDAYEMSPWPDDGAGRAEIAAIVERAGRDVALVEEIGGVHRPVEAHARTAGAPK